MPWPLQITRQDGFLALDHSPRIKLSGGDERVHRALKRFARNLSLRTGVPFDQHLSQASDGPLFVIHCSGPGLRIQALEEDESYHLMIDSKGIELTAANPLGIMHGLETLLSWWNQGRKAGFSPTFVLMTLLASHGAGS